MEVLDTTIVNVALPSIQKDLLFDASSLAWVINAYLLTFGGFLLLGGRLGDLFGARRLFLIGIAIFTGASLLCGLAFSQEFLIIMRALQGIGGAITSAVSLALIMQLYVKENERAKAMGFFGFVAAGGGSLGVMLGGFLTSISWHWIFLVNVPIGIAVFCLALYLLPHSRLERHHRHLDLWGASLITTSMMIAVFAIVGGNDAGWLSLQTIGLLLLAAVLFAAFIRIEMVVRGPLIPLHLFKRRNILISNAIGVLWAAAMFAWFFMSALYMQLLLGYSPLQVGLAFLPANLIMAAFSLGLSAAIVLRYGIKRPISVGMSSAAIGLLLLGFAPLGGSFWLNLLPSMIFLGLGAGVAFNPVLLAAMSDVGESESGLASGLVNTSFMMGGALGLAILASLAFSITLYVSFVIHDSDQVALIWGYHVAFFAGALFALIAAGLAFLLRPKRSLEAHAH
jgi:EmrB/QacA subfamily drug resistance transporter